MLNLQTSEHHHIFQWLKLQARRGAAEAEVPCSITSTESQIRQCVIKSMSGLSSMYVCFSKHTFQSKRKWPRTLKQGKDV